MQFTKEELNVASYYSLKPVLMIIEKSALKNECVVIIPS